MLPNFLANDASPLLAMVTAPLVLTAGIVPLILQADTVREQQALHPLDATDPAGWNRSREWLLGAPIEKVYRLQSSPSSTAYVAEHSSGQWRTLRRHGSVQSVTLMQPLSEEDEDSLAPFHSSVGNEYLKVMASAYAALASPQQNKGILFLGLGGGSLPMLLGEPCAAIELDEDVVDLATEFCGLDPEMVTVVRGGDALHHQRLTPGPHSCIFVDVFGRDNNVPLPFVEEEFVQGLWDSLDDENGGLVIANFHCNSGNARNEEDSRLQQATQIYSRVFNRNDNESEGSFSSSLIRIPSRYQGNMILCARKGRKNGTLQHLRAEDVDLEAARHVANEKGWMFDPGARLEKAETVSF